MKNGVKMRLTGFLKVIMIEEFKFIDIEELKEDVKNNPEKYAPWFLIILNKLYGTETEITNIEWKMME